MDDNPIGPTEPCFANEISGEKLILFFGAMAIFVDANVILPPHGSKKARKPTQVRPHKPITETARLSFLRPFFQKVQSKSFDQEEEALPQSVLFL